MTVTFDFNVKDINRRMAKGIKEGVEALSVNLERNIKLRLSREGTGKKYPRLKKRSAAKGEPPAVQTGRLRGSWTLKTTPKRFAKGYKSIVTQTGGASAGAESPVKYGLYLETDRSGRIGKGDHPFLGKRLGAIAVTQASAQEDFNYYFQRSIRDAGGTT